MMAPPPTMATVLVAETPVTLAIPSATSDAPAVEPAGGRGRTSPIASGVCGFKASQWAMMSFPPLLPDPSWRHTIRLPRDHYVRVDTNDYSVKPRFVGR